MKSCLLPVLAAVFGLSFAAAAQTNVIVDDTWADGTYTNWNLPTECPWYYNDSTTNKYMGAIPGALIVTNYLSADPTWITGTRYWWTYFTTNDPALTVGLGFTNISSGNTNAYFGHPVDIAVGEMIQARLRFIPAAYIAPIATKAVRFGLLSYDQADLGRAARSTANITKSGTNVTGYRIDLPLYQTLDSNSLFSVRVRTNMNLSGGANEPLGKDEAYFSLGGAANLSGNAFQLDQEYTLDIYVARYSDSNVITASLSGFLQDAQTNFTRSMIDTSGSNYHKFDSFLIRVDSAGLNTDQLIFKEFKVATMPIPWTPVDPFSVSSQFEAPDKFILSWDSVADAKYRIESKADLGASSWTSNATVVATGPSTSWTNSPTPPAGQFYRVVNVPPF